MSRKRPLKNIDVRAILESTVGRIGEGPPIGAYEAGMRRAAEDASTAKMAAAKRFLGALESYGLLECPEPADEHQYLIRLPKEWDYSAWLAMFDELGPPPWRGPSDGLIPAERWEANYGTRLRRVGRAQRPKC